MFNHFGAAVLFALCTAIVFGITQRADPRAMLRFGLYCFVMMVGAVIAGSWLMFAIKH